MGFLIDGVWRDERDFPKDSSGHFVRPDSPFRNWVTSDGAPGPSGVGGFKAESGRYQLYVSLACPWAHRALIVRKLKGLESAVGLSVVHWRMAGDGWTFQPGPGVIPDPVLNARFLHEIYTAAKPDYTGRVTVPILWDRENATIVSNESSEIIRMFNSAFAAFAKGPDFYPEKLRAEIDALNDRIYKTVNNGVYRAGFAGSQSAYTEAVGALFATLDWLEARLSTQETLCGGVLTEADWRLFTTLIRFDPVYVGHFKCNIRRIVDHPALQAYLRRLYRHAGVAETVDFFHIKHHYYESHPHINPSGIVPAGPILSL